MDIQTRSAVPADPWEAAQSRFLESISEEEKQCFRKANASNLYRFTDVTVKKHISETKMQEVARKLQPLTNALESFEKLINMTSNGASAVMGPLWGSIRVLLRIAQAFKSFFDKTVDMLTVIGDELQPFQKHKSLFTNQDRLRQALYDAYLEIIDFCTDAKNAFLKAKRRGGTIALRVLWPGFARQFDACVSSIRQKAGTVNNIAQTHMVAEKKEQQLDHANRERWKKGAEAERRQKTFDLVSTLDYETHHSRILGTRCDGTGLWFTVQDSFRSWLDQATSSHCWCYGAAGSGKTVLAASIIDQLAPRYETKSSALAYYYCDYAKSSTLDANTVLRTLARQLFERAELTDGIANEIRYIFEDRTTRPSFETILDLLIESLDPFSNILLVVDGLDELDREAQVAVIRAMKRISSQRDRIVKVLIFSRWGESFKRAFSGGPSIGITPNHLQNDIARYVTQCVEDNLKSGVLPIQDPSLKHHVIETLRAGAEGLFLWVKLQIQELCDARAEHQIREMIGKLPATLPETYARIIRKIAKAPDAQRRLATLRKLLPWLICARTPLTLAQLAEIGAIDIHSRHLDPHEIPDKARLLSDFSHLVVFDKTDTTVRLAHQTVKQYFLGSHPGTTGKNYDLELSRKEAEQEVGELCVVYLMLSDFEITITERRKSAMHIQSDFPGPTPIAEPQAPQSKYNRLSQLVRARPVSFIAPSRLEQPVGLPPGLGALHKKYALLDYAIAHWTSHTAKLRLRGTVWSGLRSLAFDRQILANRRPWEVESSLSKVPEASIQASIKREQISSLIGWALRNNAPAFLEQIDTEYLKEYLKRYCAQSVLINIKLGCGTFEAIKRDVSHQLSNPVAYACASGYYEALEKLIPSLEAVGQLNPKIVSLIVLANAEAPRSFLEPIIQSWGTRYGMKAYRFALQHAIFSNHPVALDRLICDPQQGVWPPEYVHLVDEAFLSWVYWIKLDIISCLDSIPKFLSWYTPTNTALPTGRANLAQECCYAIMENDMPRLNAAMAKFDLDPEPPEFYSAILDLALAHDIPDAWQELMCDIDTKSGDMIKVAVSHGHDFVLQELFQQGDINSFIRNGTLAESFEAALRTGENSIAVVLLQQLRLDAKFPTSASALHLAAWYGSIPSVKLLLEMGADVNLRCDRLGTPLYAASYNNQIQIVSLLLEKGASVDISAWADGKLLGRRQSVGHRYMTALAAAAGRGHTSIVQALMNAKGRSGSPRRDDVQDAIVKAKEGGHTDILYILDPAYEKKVRRESIKLIEKSAKDIADSEKRAEKDRKILEKERKRQSTLNDWDDDQHWSW